MLRFLRILGLMLLPFALFAAALLLWREQLMTEQSGVRLILLFLVALALLALVEGLLFRYRILPLLGEAIGEHIYGGSYVPGEDALVVLTARLRESRSPELLAALEKMVRQQKRRTRGWLELARAQQDVFGELSRAAETLAQGAGCVSSRQDRALLLYRAAMLYRRDLHDEARATEYFGRAARRYPNTTYGRRAAEQLATPPSRN